MNFQKKQKCKQLQNDSVKVAGRVRFELTTSSLEGWLAIRAATSAPSQGNVGTIVLSFLIAKTG
jgi:hypothetical protein